MGAEESWGPVTWGNGGGPKEVLLHRYGRESLSGETGEGEYLRAAVRVWGERRAFGFKGGGAKGRELEGRFAREKSGR